jgi:hypothetical protein
MLDMHLRLCNPRRNHIAPVIASLRLTLEVYFILIENTSEIIGGIWTQRLDRGDVSLEV